MVRPFYHEQAITIDGGSYRLVLNFAAIDAAETLLAPLSFDAIVGQMLDGTASMATQARVVWGLLRTQHPEMTVDQAMSFVVGPWSTDLGVAIGNLILAAFPLKSDEPVGDQSENPPKPRGASRNS